jgi:hypothetical protein
VDELALPIDANGKYSRDTKGGFEPAKLVWSYTAPKKKDFYSFFISGAQRLPNGNTLICSGANGTAFEVTPDNETVWKYVNPVKGTGTMPGGRPVGNPSFNVKPGQILVEFLQDMLGLSSEQKKQIGQFQKDVDDKLDKLLQEEQKKQLNKPQGTGPASFPQPGQIMSPTQQAGLKLTPEQRKQLRDLQKQVDDQLDKILSADQKKQFKDLRANPGRGGPGGPPGIGNALFRAYRYPASYPGLAGKELTPGKTLEELQAKEKPKKTATP